MCVGTAMAEVNIIPKPTSVVEHEGSFLLKDGMTIGYSDASLEPAATYLQELLTQSTGLSFKTKAGKGKIQLSIVLPDESNEDYELVSDKKGVRITAHSYRGIINGIATLRQLLPPEIENSKLKIERQGEAYQSSIFNLQCVEVKDSPNFHWRGLMLDPVRHFFSVEETKRLLDEMALYKLNKFHWHLSDNEGFRMEVKAYPELTGDSMAWRRFNSHDRQCLDRAAKENNPAMLLPWKYFKEVEGFGELRCRSWHRCDSRDRYARPQRLGLLVLPLA